jgi:hypothetical protein
MSLFKKDEGVLDLTDLQKRGLLNRQVSPPTREPDTFVNLTSTTHSPPSSPVPSLPSPIPSLPSPSPEEPLPNPLAFLDDIAKASISTLPETNPSSSPIPSKTTSQSHPSDSLDLKVKLDDLEFKLDRLVDKLILMESKINEFENKTN